MGLATTPVALSVLGPAPKPTWRGWPCLRVGGRGFGEGGCRGSFTPPPPSLAAPSFPLYLPKQGNQSVQPCTMGSAFGALGASPGSCHDCSWGVWDSPRAFWGGFGLSPNRRAFCRWMRQTGREGSGRGDVPMWKTPTPGHPRPGCLATLSIRRLGCRPSWGCSLTSKRHRGSREQEERQQQRQQRPRRGPSDPRGPQTHGWRASGSRAAPGSARAGPRLGVGGSTPRAASCPAPPPIPLPPLHVPQDQDTPSPKTLLVAQFGEGECPGANPSLHPPRKTWGEQERAPETGFSATCCNRTLPKSERPFLGAHLE